MRNVYTVKQVNLYIKNMFSQDFMLNRIYVKARCRTASTTLPVISIFH